MEWFRFHHDFVDDIRTGIMSDTDQLIWVKVLCLANSSCAKGTIYLSDKEICWKLRTNLEKWHSAISQFESKGMIEHIQGGFKICDWSKFNPPCQEYRKHQEFVFKRDGFKCVYCGTDKDLTLDHQIPQSRGGGHEPENLVTCCATCNSSKGARTPEEWRG